MTKDEIVQHAHDVRKRWLAGELTYGEARKELKEFIKYYNELSAELAAKYNQKPQKLRVGDFLKFGVGPK